jgi:hypothetical protein
MNHQMHASHGLHGLTQHGPQKLTILVAPSRFPLSPQNGFFRLANSPRLELQTLCPLMPSRRTPALRQLAEVIQREAVNLDPRTVAAIILEIARDNNDLVGWVHQLAIDLVEDTPHPAR